MSRAQRIVLIGAVAVGLWLFDRWADLQWRLKHR